MNASEYSLRVYERISGGMPEGESPALRSSLELDLPNALRKMAQMSINADWRALLENDYALTISGLAAPFGSNTDMLVESIKVCNKITHASVTMPFRILDSVDDLPFAGGVTYSTYGFAAVGASKIEFRYPAGTLSGTLTVRCVKVPTLASIVASPSQLVLEDHLIDAGALLAMMKTAGASA